MKNKRAQLGLGTVKAVMIAFLVLAVITVAIILSMTSLTDVTDDVDQIKADPINLTTASVVNSSGTFPGGLSAGDRNCQLTVTIMSSADVGGNASLIDTSNFTISGCKITSNLGDTGTFNNTLWNVTGNYVFSSDNTFNINRNLSKATSEFFDNTSTIFAILIVVVIILAISIIILVVQGFSGAGFGGSKGVSGKSKFGSDTVMGI